MSSHKALNCAILFHAWGQSAAQPQMRRSFPASKPQLHKPNRCWMPASRMGVSPDTHWSLIRYGRRQKAWKSRIPAAGGEATHQTRNAEGRMQNAELSGKGPSCDIKATPRPVDSQLIATIKPPQCVYNASIKRLQGSYKAWRGTTDDKGKAETLKVES